MAAAPKARSSNPPVTSRGLLLVISGPSGVGKTTIARRIEKLLDGVFSVSATTRKKAPTDVEGRDYHFVDVPTFKKMIERGEFLEHANVFGENWYGTPREPVIRNLTDGRLMILEIDVQGGLQVRKSFPEAFMLLIVPPSDEELLQRLRGRGREDEAVIQRRFAAARKEIDLARDSGAYDHELVNDDLEGTIGKAIELIRRKREGS
jgi:guanylate kinase